MCDNVLVVAWTTLRLIFSVVDMAACVHAGASLQLGAIKAEVDKTIAEAQDKLKRKPDRASSPSLMNGHASAAFTSAGSSGDRIRALPL